MYEKIIFNPLGLKVLTYYAKAVTVAYLGSGKQKLRGVFYIILALSILVVLLICLPIILACGSGMLKKITNKVRRSEGNGGDVE